MPFAAIMDILSRKSFLSAQKLTAFLCELPLLTKAHLLSNISRHYALRLIVLLL